MQTRKVIVEVIVILYASLFVYTGIHKLMDFELNREQLSIMPIVAPLADLLSWLLPLVEFIIAALIFLPKTRTVGLILGTGLMTGFTGYVLLLMSQPGDLPCTCGGFLQALTWSQHLIFNVVFVLLGVWAIAWSRKSRESGSNVNYLVINSKI